MKLNVGCGSDPWGNVRLDISKCVPRWLGKKSTANIVADARFLPFRTKCFRELRIHQVLEHIVNWKKTLSECCRVSSKLDIMVPVVSSLPKMEWVSLFSLSPAMLRSIFFDLRKRTREHLWQFNANKLASLLTRSGFMHVEISKTYRPIIGLWGYGSKNRCFKLLSQRLKQPQSWRIIAWQ